MEFKLENRFWPKVDKKDNGCWEWTGCKVKGGYGRYCIKNVMYLSHRVVMNCFDPNIVVCHKCDNPPCVNPDHLFLGTNKDNTQDCVKKGRFKSNGKLPIAVICIETDTKYSSIHAASRAMNIAPSGIVRVLQGCHKKAGGCHWRRV